MRVSGSISDRLYGAAFSAALELWLVSMMFADVDAQISALLGLVRAVRALVRRLLVAALVVLVTAQCRLPAVELSAVAARERALLVVAMQQLRTLRHHDLANLLLDNLLHSDARAAAVRRAAVALHRVRRFGRVQAVLAVSVDVVDGEVGEFAGRLLLWALAGRLSAGRDVLEGAADLVRALDGVLLARGRAAHVVLVQHTARARVRVPQVRVLYADALLVLASQDRRLAHDDGRQRINANALLSGRARALRARGLRKDVCYDRE